MNTSRISMIILAALIAVGLFASPGWAHTKYWPNASGVLVPYHHQHDEPASVAKTQSPDLLGGAARLVGGTFKGIGNLIGAAFGGQKEPAGKAPEPETARAESEPRMYREFPNASGVIVRAPVS